MLYNFYPNTNYDGISVTDILKRFKFSDEFLKSSFVENYTLKEEDSPESLAYLLYKDPKMSWLVLLLNNMSDRNTDWPYSYRNMERVLEKKYKGTSFFYTRRRSEFCFVRLFLHFCARGRVSNKIF